MRHYPGLGCAARHALHLTGGKVALSHIKNAGYYLPLICCMRNKPAYRYAVCAGGQQPGNIFLQNTANGYYRYGNALCGQLLQDAGNALLPQYGA